MTFDRDNGAIAKIVNSYCDNIINGYDIASPLTKKGMFLDLLDIAFVTCMEEMGKLDKESFTELVMKMFDSDIDDNGAYLYWYNFWKSRNIMKMLSYPIYSIGFNCLIYAIDKQRGELKDNQVDSKNTEENNDEAFLDLILSSFEKMEKKIN